MFSRSFFFSSFLFFRSAKSVFIFLRKLVLVFSSFLPNFIFTFESEYVLFFSVANNSLPYNTAINIVPLGFSPLKKD